jgi:excisionase family DNA binding protein
MWNVYSNMEQEYFTPRELAEWLRVDYTTVMRWIRVGLLPVETIRQGKRHRIREAAIEAFEIPPSSPRFG